MSTIDFTNGDDLSDLLGGSVQAAPRVLPQDAGLARIRAEKTGVIESCPKCRGTGNWRPGYPCFACKGKGNRTFTNTAEVRMQNREKAADRKVAQGQNRLEHFAGKGELEAAMVTWMQAKRDSFAFAGAMLEAVQKYGDLTPRQHETTVRLMAKDADRAAQRAQVAVQQQERVAGIDVANIVDCFVRAQEAGLKRFTLRFDGVHFQVDRNDPALIWVSASGYGSAKYGLIKGGAFRPGRDATDAVLAQIALISADPMAAAKAYVQITSNCSVCGRHLENQDSVDAGMGPVCAGRINRPGLKFVEVKAGEDF